MEKKNSNSYKVALIILGLVVLINGALPIIVSGSNSNPMLNSLAIFLVILALLFKK